MLRTHRLARAAFGVALAAALLAAPARAADIDKYLPDGTIFVLSVNVKNLLDSPLLRGDEKAFKTAMGEAAKALEEFGVDPAKDLNRVVIAAGEGAPNNALVLVEGTFNTAKLQSQLANLAKEKKGNVEPAEGAPAGVYQVKLPPQARRSPGMPDRFLFTVLDRNFLAIAPNQMSLEDVLAKKKGDKKTEIKQEMLQEIGKINPRETASVVIIPPQQLLQGGPAAGMTKITGGVTVGQGVKTDILLTTKDGDAAKDLAKAINDGLAQVKQLIPIFAGNQPGVGQKEIGMITELIDSFKATAQPKGVSIKSEITKDFIDKAKQAGQEMDKDK
ncbi:MAG TPA: hypothetical protein VL371_19480 [Gemmataceae bacterium]|nr:hypothetical protein [Gemmataceae bacterium]